MRQRIEQFLARSKEAKTNQKVIAKVQPRLANYLVCKGLHHTIRMGMGLSGLDHFAATRSTWKLLRTGRKYWIPSDNLPPQALQHGQKRRLCVEVDEKERCLAVSYSKRPKLHLLCDQGSVGWSAGVALYNHFEIRGSLEADFVHMTMNQVKSACYESGLQMVPMEVNLVVNFFGGPFRSDSHHQQVKAAAADYFANTEVDCPLFGLFYEGIAKDQNMDKENTFGSWSHMKQVLRRASECPLFERKGAKSQMSRWWSCHDTSMVLLPWVHTLALVVSEMLINKGILTSVEQLPFYVGPCALEGNLGSAATPGARAMELSKKPIAHPRNVADSNRELNKMQSQRDFQSQMHLVNHILCSPRSWSLMTMMNLVNQPTRTWHGSARIRVGTRRGCLDFRLDMARGGWMLELVEIAGVMARTATVSQFLATEADTFDTEAKHFAKEQQLLTQFSADYLVNLLGWRLMGGLALGDTFPGKLALLISPNKEEVQKCLAELKEWFATLEECENLKCPIVDAFLKDIWWPRWEWICELRVILSEFEWAEVTHRSSGSEHHHPCL
jgi:hypothetical protein